MCVILLTLSRRVFDFASKSITLAPVFPLPGRYSSMARDGHPYPYLTLIWGSAKLVFFDVLERDIL